MVTARSQYKLDWAQNPGWVQRARRDVRCTVACCEFDYIGPLRMSTLSGLKPSLAARRRHSTSLAFMTTHQSYCYQHDCKS